MNIRVGTHELPFPFGTLAILTLCLVALAITIPIERASTPDTLSAPIRAIHDEFTAQVAAMERTLEEEMTNRAARGEPREFLVTEARARHQEALKNYSADFEARVAALGQTLPWIRFLRRWGADPTRLRVAAAGRTREAARRGAWFLVTLVTCQYIHAGYMHFVGNMIFLLLFGPTVESRLGSRWFLALYTLGGVVATLTQFLAGSTASICIGASGAIAAVMGAFLFLAPEARISLGWLLGPLGFLYGRVPAAFFLFVFMIVQWAQGLSDAGAGVTSGVAWFAHIGGFAAGCAWMLSKEALEFLRIR